MNYNIELKHQEKDNQLTISIHVEDLPINCLKNLEYIKEDAEKAVTSYLDLLRGEKVHMHVIWTKTHRKELQTKLRETS